MEIIIAQEQGRMPVTVMHIDGSLNAVTSDQFQARALEAIEAGHRDLLLDLQKVPYLSSAGLRVINVIYARLNPDSSGTGVLTGKMKSPHLKLLNPTPRVLQVLQMAGYDMFLEIHQDLRDALASF